MQEIVIDYSECAAKAPISPASPSPISDKVTYSFKSSTSPTVPTWSRRFEVLPYKDTGVKINTTICSIIFDIPNPIGPPVFLYYRLTNFYQNHRRYVQSLDLDQLKGKPLDNSTIAGSSCDPLATDPVTHKAYYPCGLIANSVFNDSIQSPNLLNNYTYFMTNRGIAWASDQALIQKTQYEPWQVSPPPNWRERYPHGYTTENPIPDLHEDEDFMVWMRTAGLPSFSKLARRNDTTAMPAGTYQLDIHDCTLHRLPAYPREY